jgi:hypothetical protein
LVIGSYQTYKTNRRAFWWLLGTPTMVLPTEAATARPVDAGDRCDDAHLSHAHAFRLEHMFAQHYVARIVAGSVDVSIGASVSFKSDGRRLYGTLQSIQGEAAHIKLDGSPAWSSKSRSKLTQASLTSLSVRQTALGSRPRRRGRLHAPIGSGRGTWPTAHRRATAME